MISANSTERKRKNKCKWDINIHRIQITSIKILIYSFWYIFDCKILNINGDINDYLNR